MLHTQLCRRPRALLLLAGGMLTLVALTTSAHSAPPGKAADDLPVPVVPGAGPEGKDPLDAWMKHAEEQSRQMRRDLERTHEQMRKMHERLRPLPGGPRWEPLPLSDRVHGAAYLYSAESSSATSWSRSGDRLTARRTDGTVTLTLTARLVDGKPRLERIQVKDGDTTHRYEQLEQVPEKHRAKVARLLEQCAKEGDR